MVSECIGHQKSFTAACRGMSQAERVRNNLAAASPMLGNEPCQGNRALLTQDGAEQLLLQALSFPSSQAGKGNVLLRSSPVQSLLSHVSHRHPGMNIIPGISGDHTVPLGHPALSMQQQGCGDEANGQVFTLPGTTHLMLPPKSTDY